MNSDEYFSVVFEDNHLIIVNKKSGVLVQGDQTGDVPISEHVKAYLKDKYKKPGNVFAGVVHRIDRPVSGLVVLAKTSKALERMNKAFSDKQVKKTYWAIVKSHPPQEEATLVHWLTKDVRKNVARAYDQEKTEAKRSELKYKMIGMTDHYFLLEVNPATGRPHQIRCQLAAIGCAIKGDLKYGFPRSNEGGGINLHAYKLEFTHPVTKESISVKAPLPDDKFWNYFKKFEHSQDQHERSEIQGDS
jgi:23S rRNA pseudouridine1911/1915/1917 synthase